MTVPSRQIQPQDGGNGVTRGSTGPKLLVVGGSTSGIYNVPLAFATPASVGAVFGRGPAVDLARKFLDDAGGQVVFVRAVTSTAATTTTGAPTKDPTSTGSCAISGTPVNDYRIAIEIIEPGDVGVATFRYALDAGPDDEDGQNRNWSTPIMVPSAGTYVIANTGLTATFTGGASTAFKVGDTYYFATTAPAMTLSDLSDALDAFRASTYDVDWIHVVGEASASIAAGVKSKVDSWETTYNRYSFVVLEATDVTPIGTVSKTGTTPPDLVVTGLPLRSYNVVVDITLGGALGTMKYKYSLDGGLSFSDEITSTVSTGITSLSGTGMIFTFATGTYNTDNEYTFSTWDAEPNRAAWDTALRTAYVNFVSDKTIVCAGFGECVQADGQIKRRSIAWGISSLIGRVGLSTDLGSIDDAGTLPGFLSVNHNEYKNPGLDDQGFCVARTWNSADNSLAGIYCNQGRIMAPPGSDYDLVQYRRVMNAAFKALDPALARTVNKKIRVNPLGHPSAGYIQERYARALDRLYTSVIEDATTKKGHGSAVVVKMVRDENLLSTRHGHVDIQIVGDAYIKTLTARVGYLNPALVRE
jgi:hypothetical protein